MEETGDQLVGPAVELVRSWVGDAERSSTRAERRTSDRLHRLTGDPRSVAFTMAFCDRVMRPDTDRTAAEQLRKVVAPPLPPFLGVTDRVLLRLGSWLSRPVPGIVMPLARRRLRGIVGGLVVDSTDPALGRHLRALDRAGFDVNANLLGELVLGDEEAARRRQATIELLGRDDIDYVSVKASSVASQINLWAYDHAVERVAANLRPLLVAAAASVPPKFVNLDMEEYKDLHLTIDAFTRLLDEPELHGIEAGIVLQAYLPDSFDALQELVSWAQRRRAAGGAGIKVRVVKGANLAMERVDGAMHGWNQAPYATKAETDANYKRMLDWAFQPDRVAAVRIGVASHNLFDIAWATLLAEARGVTDRVEPEMLQGMAPGVARTVRAATGRLLLYTPVVDAADFDTALAYLFRRLEENSSGENFIRHLFDLAGDPARLAAEQARFERAVADRWVVSATPRRQAVAAAGRGFRNEPDSDPTDPAARARIAAALATPPAIDLPDEAVDSAAVDAVVAAARHGAVGWQALEPAARQGILRRVADELSNRRPHLMSTMAAEAGKTVAEGDTEVSEAIDFARYYAEEIPALERDAAAFGPFGVIAVVPPWNFPLAIPAGGVLAALAAGNAVVLKPAPQTPRTAYALAEACWAGGVPRDALQFLRCPDGPAGEHLIGHAGIDAIVLTGAYETAQLFRRLAPSTPLFAETSGKNAVVVLPDADLDLAVADLVRSAFGHAGQKCSAASLAICVGEVATSPRFRRQLVDATRTLVVGDARRPESVMGPLIEAPSDKLHRALTTLEPGQRWLLEPRALDPATNLWSPGILDGVAPGSWFHQTECFGPVLGLMAAADLDAAIAIQNGVAYGLTGGIHTLDPSKAAHWLDRVEVGNAYVNRAITGAIVQRQPFGGWKRSVVGPGAKAGGPNYLAQLGHWTSAGLPHDGREPAPQVSARLRALVAELAGTGGIDPADRTRLEAAARSDALAWAEEVGTEHDPTGLFCEANVFRYRPLRHLIVRVAANGAPIDVGRVLLATALAAPGADVSVDPEFSDPLVGVEHRRETLTEIARRIATQDRSPDRVRLVGDGDLTPADLPGDTYLDARPPIDDGRIELTRYVREQAVSRTLHRFGNLLGAGPSTSEPTVGPVRRLTRHLARRGCSSCTCRPSNASIELLVAFDRHA